MTAMSKFFLALVLVNLFFFGVNIAHGILKPNIISIIIGLINLGAAVFLLFVRTKLE